MDQYVEYKGLYVKCNQGTLEKYKKGLIGIEDTLVSEEVYQVKDNTKARTFLIKDKLKTDNWYKVLKIILENGVLYNFI